MAARTCVESVRCCPRAFSSPASRNRLSMRSNNVASAWPTSSWVQNSLRTEASSQERFVLTLEHTSSRCVRARHWPPAGLTDARQTALPLLAPSRPGMLTVAPGEKTAGQKLHPRRSCQTHPALHIHIALGEGGLRHPCHFSENRIERLRFQWHGNLHERT